MAKWFWLCRIFGHHHFWMVNTYLCLGEKYRSCESCGQEEKREWRSGYGWNDWKVITYGRFSQPKGEK